MRIEATAKDVRALLELAELDRGADQTASKARAQARATAARRVAQPLLDRYELLLEVGRSPVLVAIERGACSGCHVRLPTMVADKARRSAAVHTCPHCRRLLYEPEVVRGEPVAPASATRRS